MVDRKSRMTKEPKEEVGTLPETCDPAIHLDTDVVGRCRGGISERVFDMAMAPLRGVHIRRIGRQPFQFKVGMCGHLVLDDDGSMRIEPIPDNAHRPREVPLEVLQGHQHICGPDGRRNMTRVDRAGPRQAHHRGPLPALAHAP